MAYHFLRTNSGAPIRVVFPAAGRPVVRIWPLTIPIFRSFMKKLPLVFLFFLIGLGASAQKYRTAIGARIDRNDFGVSLQQKIMERNTLEGIFAVGSRDATGTVLFEHHFPILGKGFNYYLGGGAHVGSLKDHGTFFGGDVILGTELKLPIFPLLLSFDIKPAMHINHEDWFDFASGFTLRYILVKEKKEKKKFGIFGGGDKDDRKNNGVFGDRTDSGDKNRRKNKGKNEPRKKGWFGL
jgi:hypothetical protein